MIKYRAKILFASTVVCFHVNAGAMLSRMALEESAPTHSQASLAAVNAAQPQAVHKSSTSRTPRRRVRIDATRVGIENFENNPWHSQQWRAMLNTHIMTGWICGVENLFGRGIFDTAALNSKDPNGDTPLQLAKKHNRIAIIALLKKAGAIDEDGKADDGAPGPSNKKRTCDSVDNSQPNKKICSPALSMNDLVLSDDEE